MAHPTPPSETTSPSVRLRAWQFLLASAFPALLLVQLALNLYTGNEEYLVNADRELLLVLGFSGALWVTLAAVQRWGGFTGRVLWSLAVAYAVFVVVREQLFPLPLGLLDGFTRFPRLHTSYRLMEAGTIVGVFTFLIVVRERIAVMLTAIGSVVFGFSCVVAVLHSPASFGLAASNQGHGAKVVLNVPTAQGNAPDIYQILFDEYQTVEHQYVRRERGPAPFDDFICFENNISNYNHTWLSLPSLLMGAEYPPDMDIRDWASIYNREGLLKSLKDNGYRIRVFGYTQSWWRSPLIDYSRCTNEIMEEWHRGHTGDEFINLVKMRVYPSSLSRALHPCKRKSPDNATIPPTTDSAFYCTLKYREMVRGIRNTPNGGNYTFLHMILPHGPFVVDEEGNYVGSKRGTRMGHVHAVDHLVAELVAELKRLGRYESSLIVVHADTGSYYVPKLDVQSVTPAGSLKIAQDPAWNDVTSRDGAQWPIPIVESRVNAALLIKPPHHQGYETHQAPSQLLDLPPTILNAVGLREAAAGYGQGYDLLQAPPGAQRVRKTYVFGAKRGGPQVPRMQEFIIEGGRFTKGGLVNFTGVPLE